MRDYGGIVAAADKAFRERYPRPPRVLVREAGETFMHPGTVYTVDYMPNGCHKVQLHHHHEVA